jgi:tRNA(Ile2)-agmatinylcytidine synthase
MGKGQGYRCDQCGLRERTLEKVVEIVQRDLKKKLFVTSPRSQRHLTKPLSRYGLEKTGKKKPEKMIAAWHFP